MALIKESELKNDIEKFDINIYISDRAGRKSSLIQEFLITEWEKNDFKPLAVVLRNKADELITANWFSEYILKKFKKYQFYNKKISSNINAICCRINDEEKTLFFNLFVSLSRKYKSSYYNGFETVKYIVYEECIEEKRLPQNINYIEKSDEELFRVFSIGSTVCRLHRPKYIFLGNDIKYNLLNPVTVKFQILDRLKINERIQDKITLYNNDYIFNFLYFSFKGSTNHWLKYFDKYIIKDEQIKSKPLNYIFTYNNKNYFLYKENNIVYVTDFNKEFENITEEAIIKRFFSEKVYNQYEFLNKKDKQVFLEILRIRSNSFNYVFNLYYKRIPFENIFVYEFIPPESDKYKKYNINNLLEANISELIKLNELNEFFESTLNCHYMYSNYLIKIYFEEFKNLILRVFYKL